MNYKNSDKGNGRKHKKITNEASETSLATHSSKPVTEKEEKGKRIFR